jgi:hypothetical protein
MPVFEGLVHGVAFGATPAEVWVLSQTRLVRLLMVENDAIRTFADESVKT